MSNLIIDDHAVHQVAVSQNVLLALTGEAAEPAVEAVVLLVDGFLLNTSVNNLFLRIHLNIDEFKIKKYKEMLSTTSVSVSSGMLASFLKCILRCSNSSFS